MDRIDWGDDAFDALIKDCIEAGERLPRDDFERASRYIAHELGTELDATDQAHLSWLLGRDLRFAAAWSIIPPDWAVELRRDKSGVVTLAIEAPCQNKSVAVTTSEVGAAILAGLATAIVTGPAVEERSDNSLLCRSDS